MALNILHVIKRPTVLDLDQSVYGSVVPGMAASVMAGGSGPNGVSETTMTIAPVSSAAVIGLFQVPSVIPAYQSTGLLETQLAGAPGSPGGGTKVSVVAGAGAVVQTDQISGTPAAGALLGVVGSAGLLGTYSAGTVVGIVLQLPADNALGSDYASAGLYTVQLRI